jgi:hypothetical protein
MPLRIKMKKSSRLKGCCASKEAIKNNNITIDSLSQLLNKDYKLAINQVKWFKSIHLANINVLEQVYTLQVTGNKRELIYLDNKLIGTDSFKLKDGTILIKEPLE